MGYVYAALWFIVGMILVFKMGKENKAFFADFCIFIILSR